MFETTTTYRGPVTPGWHAVDATALRTLVAELADARSQLRTPYRPKPEARVMRPTPGPRAPIPADVLDTEIDTDRTVAFVVADIMADHPGAFRYGPADDVQAQLTWLSKNAAKVADMITPGDVADLEVVAERCRRLAGMPDKALEDEARRAQLAKTMAVAPEVWASSVKVKDLAVAATGIPLGHRTVVKWAKEGRVAQRETGGWPTVEYRLTDVIAEQQRRAAENTPTGAVAA
ncbi:hypothetical protein [Corynebacterium variabile]|uniref:hypothetical protein n=1 Tax=Corynebacterium variabile TaxID=1727 RepID=UPI003FCF3698